ncbi:hypothetical protein LTR85_004948 [Meristemomyces frigidus]|nr:hypothetical protein LTR85_004948 [Meristemomyces frigidus]
MAPTDMQTFVRGRNGNPSADGNRPAHASGGQSGLDDLKVAPPPVSNSRATRSKTQHQPLADHGRGRSAPQQPRRPSNALPQFYDTDASDADRMSNTVSVKHANAGHGRPQQPDVRATSRGVGSEGWESAGGSGEEGEEGEDEEYDDDDLPHDPLTVTTIDGRLNKKQMGMVHALKGGKSEKFNGDGLGYVKGDSYPSTTSGRPSVSDLGERTKAQPTQQNQAAPMVPSQLASRQPERKALVGPQSIQNPKPARQSLAVTQKQDGLYQAPVIARDSLEQEASAGFSFGKAQAPKQQAAARQPAQPHRQIMQQPQGPQHSLSANTAQHGSHAALKPDHADGRQPAFQKPILQPDEAAALREKRRSKSEHVSRTTTPTQQQVVETAPEPEPPSDAVLEKEHDLPHGPQHEVEQREEPEERLDYEPSELYAMEYRALKKAEFDIDPNAAPFNMSNDQSANSLAEQLASVSRLQPKDQAHFMATLDISQWEDAGEWFLGRFAELVSRFKGARQAKRKAASRFEDEIEERHGAVSKKRKLTESALSEMKASGAQVLQGTPKKMKKMK